MRSETLNREKRRERNLTTTKKIIQAKQNNFDTDRSYDQLDIGPFHLSNLNQATDIPSMVKEFNFTKREFLQELFKEYNELPFAKCLQNFAKVFNDLFLHGKFEGQAHYTIREVQIIEM